MRRAPFGMSTGCCMETNVTINFIYWKKKNPTINKAYHSQIHKILRQGKNHESSKGKKVLNLQGKTYEVCRRPIHRIWQARKEWQDIFNVLNQKNMQPRIFYPARLSFKIER